MRVLFKVFGFLDIICLLLLGMQIWLILTSNNGLSSLINRIDVPFKVLTFILIAISCIGLLRFQKWGIMAYYAQFPLRLWLFIYSIGFITLLPEFFGFYEDFWFDWLLGMCVFFEFSRLYFIIQTHRTMFR